MVVPLFACSHDSEFVAIPGVIKTVRVKENKDMRKAHETVKIKIGLIMRLYMNESLQHILTTLIVSMVLLSGCSVASSPSSPSDAYEGEAVESDAEEMSYEEWDYGESEATDMDIEVSDIHYNESQPYGEEYTTIPTITGTVTNHADTTAFRVSFAFSGDKSDTDSYGDEVITHLDSINGNMQPYTCGDADISKLYSYADSSLDDWNNRCSIYYLHPGESRQFEFTIKPEFAENLVSSSIDCNISSVSFEQEWYGMWDNMTFLDPNDFRVETIDIESEANRVARATVRITNTTDTKWKSVNIALACSDVNGDPVYWSGGWWHAGKTYLFGEAEYIKPGDSVDIGCSTRYFYDNTFDEDDIDSQIVSVEPVVVCYESDE